MDIGEARRLHAEILRIADFALDRLRDEQVKSAREARAFARWVQQQRVDMRFDIELRQKSLDEFKRLDELDPHPEYPPYIIAWEEKLAMDRQRLKSFEAIYSEDYPEEVIRSGSE